MFQKSVRFFINTYIFEGKKFPRLNSGQYPVWMTQKPRKGDLRETKSKYFSGVHAPWPPRRLCLWCLFRKLVSIYPRSAPWLVGKNLSLVDVHQMNWVLTLKRRIKTLTLFPTIIFLKTNHGIVWNNSPHPDCIRGGYAWKGCLFLGFRLYYTEGWGFH